MTIAEFRSAGPIAGLLTILLSVPALASDSKAYHGAWCQPTIPQYDGDTVSERSYRGLKALEFTIVGCPLVRDTIGSSTSLNQVSVEVYHATSHSGSCSLYTQIEDNQGGGYTDYMTVTKVGGGLQQFTFLNPVSTAGNEASMWVSCTLLPEDILLHVYVNED